MLRTIASHLFHAYVYAAAAIFTFLAVAYGAAPVTYSSEELDQAAATAAAHEMDRFEGSDPVTVSLDGHDPSPQFLRLLEEEMKSRRVTTRIDRLTSDDNPRPDAGLACVRASASVRCIDVVFDAMPLWRTATIDVQRPFCSTRLVLVRSLARWHVVKDDFACWLETRIEEAG